MPYVKETNAVKDSTVNKVKIKRSFRGLFHKRNAKRVEMELVDAEPKQAFMVGARSSFAKRIRNSAALSKAHIPNFPDSKPESVPQTKCEEDMAIEDPNPDISTKDADRGVALSSPEASSSNRTPESSSISYYDTATVINNIINRVTSVPTDSLHRMRGLEIAEVCSTLYFYSHMRDNLSNVVNK